MKKVNSPKLEFNSHAEISMSAYCIDEPIAYRIVRSGWGGPTMYHVIVEFGDFEQTEYRGIMSAQQIEEKFGFTLSETETLTSYDKKYPNNMDLGRELRIITNQYKQKTQI